MPPGTREFAHTADLGLAVEADSLEQLFRRAAAGTMALVAEPAAPAPEAGERIREVVLEAEDVETLFLRWLREILYLQETEDFTYGGVTFDHLDASGLRATIRAPERPPRQVRELKGVTWHGLEVRRDGGGWRARVIFDI